MQGHLEKSEAPGQKRKMRPPAIEASRKFYSLELYNGRLFLVYLMRPPHLEECGVMRPLGPRGPGVSYPLPSSWRSGLFENYKELN